MVDWDLSILDANSKYGWPVECDDGPLGSVIEIVPPGNRVVFPSLPGVKLVNESDKDLYVHALKLSQPK